MRRVIIIAVMLAFAARAQDAASWWGALAAGGAAALPDVTDGLVAWWKFDDTFIDETGNGHTLTNHGCEFVTGKICNALSLTASENDYAIGSDAGFPDGTNSRTVTMWVKADSYVDQVALLYGTENSDLGFFVAPSISSKMFIGFYFVNAPASISAISLNEWQLLTFVYYSSTDCGVYINESYEAVSSSQIPNTILSGKIYIGRLGSLDGLNLNGLIDDVRIYNRALSSNEVTTIYNRYK